MRLSFLQLVDWDQPCPGPQYDWSNRKIQGKNREANVNKTALNENEPQILELLLSTTTIQPILKEELGNKLMSDSSNTQALPSGPEPDLSGRQYGDYRLLRRLGRGGMATVYLAEQDSLQRKVAFKALRPTLANDTTYVQRFHQEAQAAAALVHANIVQIYEVGLIDSVHFIAMEYVAGQTLRQLISRSGPLSAEQCVPIMRQVAAALHKSSTEGVTHRDIKPENILITPSGEIKVADFGLARVAQNGEASNLTQVGMAMGTPLYMSPEQAEGREVDPRSDLYSFGITCYHMLSGEPPFTGDSPLAIALQHVKNEPDRLEDARPDLPSGLCRIVHKLLAKQPEKRFQRAAELLNDLRSLHIEGLEGDWPSAIDEWSTPELIALSEGRAEATRMLGEVMRKESGQSKRSGWSANFKFAVVAFLAGCVGAFATRPESLLEVSRLELSKVEQMETVKDQYFKAAEVGTERAWQAVYEHFPPHDPKSKKINKNNQYYAWQAKHRLAELYIDREDYVAAKRIYDDLAFVDPTESNVVAFAKLGQANVMAMQSNLVGAKKKLTEVAELFPKMRSDGLRRELALKVDPKLRLEFEQLTGVRDERRAGDR
ncbi:MAG: serine/threonine protein kinase [Pirellulaceae bacterium]